MVVDFSSHASLADFADKVNGFVNSWEETDPWVKAEYGIEGPGEGLVFYANPTSDEPAYKGFMFKAKGEKHRVNKTKTAAQVDPEVLRSTQAFVDFAITIPRLEQGLAEIGDAIPENTGPFLKWVMNDVLKECTPELADSGLTWKQVSGSLARKAREWFLEKGKVI